MKSITFKLAVVAGALAVGLSAANAKTLRWASQGDAQTMDPVAQNEGVTNNINYHIYERLTDRNEKLEIGPGLATDWKQMSDLVWRFNLRKGVKFHDGTPFTADDVVFSFERASHANSQINQYAIPCGKVVKIDDFTVEFRMEKPNPVFLQHLDTVLIMSKAWSVKNKVERPQNFKDKEETFAARNANGTGPYMLKSRAPGERTVMSINTNWWNKHKGNVTEIVYTPVSNDATRLAALQSGELDLLQDPPVQNVNQLQSGANTKVVFGPENRVVFFGFDQFRDELQYSSVKGKNPFKDKRVRQAVYQAIDIEAIKRVTMRNNSVPTGCMTPSPIACVDKALEARFPFDVSAAKKLLTDAGYPQGFEVTLDCPNNRYVNDEEICINVATMLSKIDIKVKVNAMPKTVYFPKLEKNDTSFYMLGWGGAITDAQTVFDPVLHSKTPPKGAYNYGRYSDPELDKLINAAAVEPNAEKRRGIIAQGLARQRSEFLHVPLHRQMIPWAMRKNVTAVHRADNYMMAQWVKID